MLRKRNKILIFVLSLVVIIGIAFASGFYFYINSLKPVSKGGDKVNFVIEAGETSSIISKNLKQKGLINSDIAFRLYTKLNGYDAKLQVGTYLLSSSSSTQEIVENIVTGKTKQMSITFYPGASLYVRTSENDSTKNHQEVMAANGYSEEQFKRALEVNQNHPLLKLVKPKDANPEGLIFGETFTFSLGTSSADIVKAVYDYYLKVIIENKLESQFAKQGLSLYEGIILSSIVEREARTEEDRKMVAQVFINRIEEGMILGSDVTYQYISRMLGVPNDMNIDSPYNTRRFGGLPPTPICSPSLSSLLAVANPKANDYLFFLAGDDQKTYFAKTNAEHEANIVNHCQIGCQAQ